MSPGPLRRLVGSLGLVALVPVAWQLWVGGLDPVGAAARAVAVLVVVVTVGRVVARWLDGVVRAVEVDQRATATAPRAEREREATVRGGEPQDVELVEPEGAA